MILREFKDSPQTIESTNNEVSLLMFLQKTVILFLF